MLTKLNTKKCIDKIPFKIRVAHYLECFMIGFNPHDVKATFLQSQDRYSKKWSETILFSSLHFPEIDLSSPKFLRVLFHELGHATGTADRLNRMFVSSKYFDQKLAAMHASDKTLFYHMSSVEELIAERTSQKLMSHFGIDETKIRIESNLYIELYVKALERSIGELSEFEAYQIEKQSNDAMAYILQNWFNEIELSQKKAA